MKPEEAAAREGELYAALSGWNVPGTVTIGGYAASARSIPRFSHDIDFLLPASSLPAAREHLKKAKLSFMKENPEVEQNYGGTFEQWRGGATDVTVELLAESVQDRTFQVPLPYALLAERAELLPLQGMSQSPLRMPVACAEALIAMKVQPMRDKDCGDICCLANGPIDEKHLRRVVAPLLKERPELLRERLAILQADLATDAQAQRFLGPRVAGPASRRKPIIRSSRQLLSLVRSWL